MSNKRFEWPRKAVAVLASAALASTMMVAPATAYADETADKAAVPTTALSTTDADGASYVTGFITKRPTPIMMILGVSVVNEGTLSFDGDYEGYGEDYAYDSTWASLKYWLTASSYNSNPDPFLANFGTGLGDASNSATTAGSMATNYLSADEDVQATWDLQPDIIYNFNSGVSSPASQYLLDDDGNVLEGFEDYDPTVLSYDSTDDTTWEGVIGNLTTLAEAADAIVEESDGTKVLRYGSAMDIVDSLEQYIFGTLGYVAESIDDGSIAKRTYVVISDVTDNGDGSYTWSLEPSGVFNQVMASAIATDLIDELGIEVTSVTTTNSKTGKTSTTNYCYATTEQLEQADLIVSSSSSNEDVIVALEAAGLIEKSYVTTTIGQGCIFNTNSTGEVAQNIGRVLGCLYPELIDQDNWLGYYLQNYYHITESSVPYLLSKVFQGVTNYDAADSNGDGTLSYEESVTWSEADGEDYDEAAVQAAIDEGYAYYTSLSTEAQAYLNNADGATKYEDEADKSELDAAIAEASETLASAELSDEVSAALAAAIQSAQAVSNDGTADEAAVEVAIETLESVVAGYASQLSVALEDAEQHYTGTALEPAVTVTNALGQTLVEGVDYVAIYTNNVKPGTATVYVIGLGSISGFAKATFTIDELTISGTASYSKRVTSAAFALSVTATEGATLAYSSSDEGVATVSAAGKVAVAGKGSATITVTASKDGYADATMQVAVTVAKPAAPTLKSVKSNKKKRVIVKAAGSAKVTGYQVWYKVAGKKAVKVKVKGSTATLSKTIKKLASGKKCTVKVRAYKTLSGTTYYSAWSAKKSVKVK